MKNYTIIAAVYLLLFLTPISAQEIAPLQLGNIWIYDYSTSLGRISVIDTSVFIDTIKYHQTRWQANYGGLEGYEFVRLKEDGYYAIRLDTSYQAPNNELLYYKKNAVTGDTWTQPDPWSPFNAVYTIVDTFVTNVFGETTTVKFLTIDSGILLFEEYWTDMFGKLSRSDFGTPITSLRGCVIDDVVYGDTSFNVVSVENEFEQPETFILQQNYPNPFNLTTRINFRISNFEFVSLIVYDVLGNEVTTLVNEEKSDGEHEITFDGSNLVSGIYIYQLLTNKKVISKKMTLLK